MGIGVKVKVWGDYALFSRPEMKVERCSYDVMTPSAARGILEAIYWHPGLKWVIDKIYVKNPIRFTSVRRNEVKSKISASNVLQVYNGADKPLYLSTKEDIVQRRNKHALAIDFVAEPPFFQVSETHAAKTWYLDPRAPKMERPHSIQNLREKMGKMGGSNLNG